MPHRAGDKDSTVMLMSGLVVILVLLLAFTTGTVAWQWRELDQAKRSLADRIRSEHEMALAQTRQAEQQRRQEEAARQQKVRDAMRFFHAARISTTAVRCPSSSAILVLFDPENLPPEMVVEPGDAPQQ